MPPLHHEILTARVVADRADLRDAQASLADVLAGLDADYEPTPAGLGVTAAWGLPYFQRLVPGRPAPLSPARPPRRQAGAVRRRAVPERPVRHEARGERRRLPDPLRRARAHRRRDQASARLQAVRAHVDPARLRRRRLRRRPLAAEADGGRGPGSGRRPDPRHRGALSRASPRRSAPGWGRARSRTSRRSATSTSAAATTSSTARTCTCRTSTRTSRRGTSTSTSTSASRLRSARTST